MKWLVLAFSKEVLLMWQGRTEFQCMLRWKNHLDSDLIKGFWSKEEDEKVENLIQLCHSFWLNIILSNSGLLCLNMYSYWTDKRACCQVWDQALGVDCQAFERTAGETVSGSLAQPPWPIGQKEHLDPGRRPYCVQSPLHSGKQVVWDRQAAPWKVGWFAVIDVWKFINVDFCGAACIILLLPYMCLNQGQHRDLNSYICFL